MLTVVGKNAFQMLVAMKKGDSRSKAIARLEEFIKKDDDEH
jgi:predicted CopG family antitoxin